MSEYVVTDAEEYFQRMRQTEARIRVSEKSTYYAPGVAFARENIFVEFINLCKSAGWNVETREVECRQCNPRKWDIIFIF